VARGQRRPQRSLVRTRIVLRHSRPGRTGVDLPPRIDPSQRRRASDDLGQYGRRSVADRVTRHVEQPPRPVLLQLGSLRQQRRQLRIRLLQRPATRPLASDRGAHASRRGVRAQRRRDWRTGPVGADLRRALRSRSLLAAAVPRGSANPVARNPDGAAGHTARTRWWGGNGRQPARAVSSAGGLLRRAASRNHHDPDQDLGEAAHHDRKGDAAPRQSQASQEASPPRQAAPPAEKHAGTGA
jgi:hypothetical protein